MNNEKLDEFLKLQCGPNDKLQGQSSQEPCRNSKTFFTVLEILVITRIS